MLAVWCSLVACVCCCAYFVCYTHLLLHVTACACVVSEGGSQLSRSKSERYPHLSSTGKGK